MPSVITLGNKKECRNEVIDNKDEEYSLKKMFDDSYMYQAQHPLLD